MQMRQSSFFPEEITLDYLPVMVSGMCLILPTVLDGRLMENKPRWCLSYLLLSSRHCLTGVSEEKACSLLTKDVADPELGP